MFSKSLQPYQRIIESTVKPAVLMSFTQEKTALYQSKIGGEPYFPYDHPLEVITDAGSISPWPKHRKTGRELMLLLQLNFEEMPVLPSFPRTGILQLFVDDNNWHNPDEQLRVIYHPYVAQEQELQFTYFDNPPDHYRVQECSISFHKETEYMTNSDFRFNQLLPEIASGQNDRLWKDYLSITDHRYSKQDKEPGYGRNKIGGYHYSQNGQDPRALRPEWQDSILLVQFQDYGKLSWGDGGSAQFFIKRKDLERLNFQNLLFHWDST